MAEPSFEDRIDVPNVAWSDVVHFIRQLSHDLRNHLNAIELQSAYISELERNDELKSEIKRLREMISGIDLDFAIAFQGSQCDQTEPDFISGYGFRGGFA